MVDDPEKYVPDSVKRAMAQMRESYMRIESTASNLCNNCGHLISCYPCRNCGKLSNQHERRKEPRRYGTRDHTDW
jgi:hypothetical protein